MTAFHVPYDDLATTLTAPHVIGDGLLVVSASWRADFAPTAQAPAYAVVGERAAINDLGQIIDLANVTIFEVTGRSGGNLSVVPATGYADIAMPTGSRLYGWLVAGHLTELQAAINAVESNYITSTSLTSTLANYIPSSQKGAANGVATLDSTSRLPTAQVPSVIQSTTYLNTTSGANGSVYSTSHGTKGNLYLNSTIAYVDRYGYLYAAKVKTTAIEAPTAYPVGVGVTYGALIGLPAAPTTDDMFAAGIGELFLDAGLVKARVCDALGAMSTHVLTNQDAGIDHRTFGCYGTPVLNAYTPRIYIDRNVTCTTLSASCSQAPSGGPATMIVEYSVNGTDWSTLATVSIADGTTQGTTAITTAIASGTWLRGKYTVVTNPVTNLNATLSFKG